MMVSPALLVIFIAVLLPYQILGQTARFNCAQQNFGATTMKSCCKIPPVYFAVDPYLSQCNPKKDRRLTQWANEFVLNKAQNFKKGNALSVSETDPNAVKAICFAAPFINCLYTAGGFFTKTGDFNQTAIFSYVMSKAPPGDKNWETILKDILESANPISSWVPTAFKDGIMCPGAKSSDPKVKVNVSSVFLTQVFQMAVINNCPAPVENTRCFNILDKFYDCSDAVWEIIPPKQQMSTASKKRKETVRKFMKKVGSVKEYSEDLDFDLLG